MNLVEPTGEKFKSIMEMTAIEVLTLATYLKEKVEIIKIRHGGKNTGAS